MSDTSDDPRELARKLAEKAKARALAKELANKAKAKAAASIPAPAPAAPKPKLSERAKRPMSAKEALRRAIEAEERKAQEPEVAPAPAPRDDHASVPPSMSPPAPTPAPAPMPAPAPEPAPAPVAVSPAAPAKVGDPAVVLANKLPGTTVRTTRVVGNRDVFKALWIAHRARAASDGNLQLMITADVLTDAADRVPDGALFAARIDKGDDSYAAWVDAESGIVLGLASPPDVYLAGV